MWHHLNSMSWLEDNQHYSFVQHQILHIKLIILSVWVLRARKLLKQTCVWVGDLLHSSYVVSFSVSVCSFSAIPRPMALYYSAHLVSYPQHKRQILYESPMKMSPDFMNACLLECNENIWGSGNGFEDCSQTGWQIRRLKTRPLWAGQCSFSFGHSNLWPSKISPRG